MNDSNQGVPSAAGDGAVAAPPAPTNFGDAFKDLTAPERRTFIACCSGVALDGMDNAFFGYAIPALIATWHISRSAAGGILTISLLAAAVGGWLAGALSDRFGRVRILQISILWFSVFSLISAFSQNMFQLALWRAVYALGFGGEIAVCIALVGEVAGPARRGTLLGSMHGMFSIGAALAALAYAVCFTFLPLEWAWRALFAIGSVPALLILYIRRNVVETVDVKRAKARASLRAPLDIFRRAYLLNTVLGSMIAWGTLAGVAGVQTWLPTYLSQARGLSVMSTTSNVVIYQLSHFVGYVTGGYFADRFGRRPSFLLSSGLSLLSVLGYTTLDLGDLATFLLAIPLGFFTATIYGGMAALFNEAYPPEIRGSGVAFCYNCGRGLAAFAPALIGYASQTLSLATSIGIFAGAAYGIVIIAALIVRETRGASLQLQSETSA